MKVLKNPWKSDFLELVSSSKKSIKITSPFVKNNICVEMLNAKQSSSKIDLITSFKLMSLHAGSLDITAIKSVIDDSGIVRNFPKIHSKIYLFDESKAVITSGNLTYGGMVNNFEYGIYVEEKSVIKNIVEDFDLLSNSEKTGIIKKSDLLTVERILSRIPKSVSSKIPNYTLETPEENLDIIGGSVKSITDSLNGWKLEVFKCVNSIESQTFNLSEINEYESSFRKKYPDNQHITDKIRQQLQYLRDLGLIEFLGNGNYRKLWK